MSAQAVLFPDDAERVLVVEGRAVALTPEGAAGEVGLDELLAAFAGDVPHTAEHVLPDGVKALVRGRGAVVVVHESPPRRVALRWIAGDSPAPFGPKVRYRTVRIALPYVVVLALFQREEGRWKLSNANECFFRGAPLKTLEDELAYPALYNCSRYPDGLPKPLSWICTAELDRGVLDEVPAEVALGRGLALLIEHLFGAGFNLSSEHHEQSSWFTETVRAKIDPRLASVEAWEEASAADALFVLDVPWLSTGMGVRAIAERALANVGRARAAHVTAQDLVRWIANRPR